MLKAIEAGSSLWAESVMRAHLLAACELHLGCDEFTQSKEYDNNASRHTA